MPGTRQSLWTPLSGNGGSESLSHAWASAAGGGTTPTHTLTDEAARLPVVPAGGFLPQAPGPWHWLGGHMDSHLCVAVELSVEMRDLKLEAQASHFMGR